MVKIIRKFIKRLARYIPTVNNMKRWKECCIKELELLGCEPDYNEPKPDTEAEKG